MKPILFVTAFMILCCSAAKSQSANHSFTFTSATESVQKTVLKRDSVVTIYPNPSYSGEVSVNAKTDQVLHFYIFDLEGTLIYQAVLKNKTKKAVANLNKGTYTYNVFANDESIEEGKLIIK